MPRDVETTNWQAPPFVASAQARFAWIEEQIKEGEGFLSNQNAYTQLASNLRIFDGLMEDKVRSTMLSNSLKYNIRKFVETISEVREIGTYGSDAKQFKPYAEMLTKVAKCIYMESGFPSAVRKTLQYAAVFGRGYLWPKVKAMNYGYGERKIVFESLGLLDVVPTQMPSTNDVQDAYANTIYTYMPVAEAHGRFPLFQSQLIPISQIDYQSRIQARRADFAERFRYGGQQRNWGNLNCEIRYTFIRDISTNSTQAAMPMGDWSKDKDGNQVPVTSWSYLVPYVGQDIFGGLKDGQKFMRPAMIEDCLIYPFLRLMISSPSMDTPLYDGPAFDWHGIMPPVQYDVDDWAWEAMGRSLVQDVGPLEVTKRKLERKMDRVINTTLNPPMGYNEDEVGGPKIENFDLFEEDVRMGLRGGKPQDTFHSILPDEVRVTAEHFKFWELVNSAEEKQLGINDLGNLAALKLNLSGESIDKALEPIGPIAKGIAARMEASNAKVAEMGKTMILQWMTTGRIIEYVGPNNVTSDIFDFEPSSLIPSHLPDEYVNGNLPTTGVGLDQKAIPSHYQPIERQRYLAKKLRLISVPSTLLKITQQQRQLQLMSLKKMQAPIGWVDIMPELGFDNFAQVQGDTILERYVNEEIEMLKVKVEMAKLAAAAGLEGGGPGQGKGGGRPASGKKPMKPSQKGGAGGQPRVVDKES
jgi:hypothetical protein